MEERSVGFDPEASPNGAAAEQHAKSHVVTRGKSDVDVEAVLSYLDDGSDDGPVLGVAGGGSHPLEPANRTRDGRRLGPGALDRMDLELRPWFTIAFGELQFECVQR